MIGCRGIGMTVGFLVAGLTSRIDPRIGMSARLSALQTASGLWMLTFDLNVTMDILVWNSADPGLRGRHHLGAADGRSPSTRWTPSDRAEASSVFHLLRNIGSSFFISLSIAEIVRTTGANYSRMTEMISPYNTALSAAGRDRGLGLRHACRASPGSPRRSRARRR